MSHKVVEKLSILLADMFTLYLKTQNFHWHVTGPNFISLHELFEMQYKDLASAIDEVAERIVVLGEIAPGTYKEFATLTTLEEGSPKLSAKDMVITLASDQDKVLKTLSSAFKAASEEEDEGTLDLLTTRIAVHEKMKWMLKSSI
jgi:starvation-inducible DNA-binding protein